MTTFSRIAAKPLAAAIRYGGNPAARMINRASWLAGKAGTRIAPASYHIGTTRREIAEILKQQKFTTGWTAREPQDASDWNELRTDIVYDKGMRLYPGTISRFLRELRTVPDLRPIIEQQESYASSILKCISNRLPEQKANLETYRNILIELKLEYSSELEILIKRLPQDMVENIDGFKTYCDLIKSLQSQKDYWASSFHLHAEDLLRKLPEEILADIGKLRQVMEFMLQAPKRAWESDQMDLLCSALISFMKTLPAGSLKGDKLTRFFTCNNDIEFRTLADNLICFHILGEEFRAILLPGDADLDSIVLRKKLVDLLRSVPLGRNNLNKMLLIPPRMLMEAGRLEKAMEIVKEIGMTEITKTFGDVLNHAQNELKEINFEIYYILMGVKAKIPTGEGLEDHMDALLEIPDKVGRKARENDLLTPIRFMRSLVKMAGLLENKAVADIPIFREYLNFWLEAYGKRTEAMSAHDYYLESLTLMRSIKDCFPKEILANEERFKEYWDVLNDARESVENSTGSAKTALKFMKSVSIFLKELPAEAFKFERFAHFFKCSSEAEIQLLMDIMTCYSVLAEDYEKTIAIGPNDLDRSVIRGKLLAAVKGINLDFSLAGLWNIPTAFLMEPGLRERIKNKIKETIPDFPENVQYSTESGLVSSLIKMRENWLWGSQMGSDENIVYLLDIINKHGSIERFYREKKPQILAELKKAGFDIEHLLGGAEILGRDISESDESKEKSAPLPERFRDMMRHIMGTRSNRPEKYFKFNRDARKLFHDLGLKAALQNDREAIEKAAKALLRMIEEERKNNKDRILEDWHDRLSGILGEIAYGDQVVTIKKMRAVRSRKLVPEILFDNQRLGCCIFWPHGEEKHEIALIALDPKTPLMEIWLEGSNESMGIVTQYLGTNITGKPVVFVDTFEGSHFIYDHMGRNRSLRFTLDALVMDAQRMGAKEAAIFKCTYGKPAEFVNFVKDQVTRSGGSITEVDNYRFTAVDAEDEALSDSKLGKHHYTDAFGLNNNLKGEKPCLVIDVPEYMKRMFKIGGSNNIPASNFKFETLTSLDHGTIEQLRAVEEEAFPEDMRYSAGYFRSLSSEKNFNVVTVKNEKEELIGFALGYARGSSSDEMFLDVMALNNKGRGIGLGKVCIDRLSQIAIGLGCKKMTLACRGKDVDGRKLVKFYESAGFVIVSGAETGAFMEKDLRR